MEGNILIRAEGLSVKIVGGYECQSREEAGRVRGDIEEIIMFSQIRPINGAITVDDTDVAVCVKGVITDPICYNNAKNTFDGYAKTPEERPAGYTPVKIIKRINDTLRSSGKRSIYDLTQEDFSE